MPHFEISPEPSLDEDGEELGAYAFDLVDASIGRLPWYDGAMIDLGTRLPILLQTNDMEGWSSTFADYCSTPIPLVADRLRLALESAGVSNVQWFATKVSGSVRSNPAYHAMNIIGSIAAVDAGRSVSHRLMNVPGADVIDHLKVDERSVAGLLLFRLAESVTTVIVSEAVKNAIESQGIETVSFTPV